MSNSNMQGLKLNLPKIITAPYWQERGGVGFWFNYNVRGMIIFLRFFCLAVASTDNQTRLCFEIINHSFSISSNSAKVL